MGLHIMAASSSSSSRSPRGISHTSEGVAERDSAGVLMKESAPDLRAAAADGGSQGEEVG